MSLETIKLLNNSVTYCKHVNIVKEDTYAKQTYVRNSYFQFRFNE